MKKMGSSTGRRAKRSEYETNNRPPTLRNCSSNETVWSMTSVHCKGRNIIMYRKEIQRESLGENLVYPSAVPTVKPIYATVCPRNRNVVQFVVTRRDADVSTMMNRIAMAIQSHQQFVPDAFCIGEVYIKWDLVVRYFGGVLTLG
jgi:hypothetical protein